MTLAEMMNEINALGRNIRAAADRLMADAADNTHDMQDIERQQNALRDMNNRMAALRLAYTTQEDAERGNLTAPQGSGSPVQERSLHDMLASREYANAFAHAIRTGAKPGRDLFADKHKVLYDALTIAGGDPAGEDGGFLVPEDIDRSIREYSRALDPLEELFNVESTTTNSGWRVVATDPTKGMTKLTGEGTNITGSGEEPTFKKVTYTLDTYGDWLQVSNELANDEVANLFAYISRYYARKYTITNNGILKAQLEKLTAGAVAKTDDALAAIKKVLNVELDPAISVLSTIIVNQDGFNYLDVLKDDNGRPLLMPDPTNATGMLLKGRRVKVLSNAVMPTRTVSTTGATKGDYYPIYIGDFTQYATLFQRQPLELTSTDIGGTAFRTNSIETRCIARMGASVFDSAAAGGVMRRPPRKGQANGNNQHGDEPADHRERLQRQGQRAGAGGIRHMQHQTGARAEHQHRHQRQRRAGRRERGSCGRAGGLSGAGAAKGGRAGHPDRAADRTKRLRRCAGAGHGHGAAIRRVRRRRGQRGAGSLRECRRGMVRSGRRSKAQRAGSPL